MEGITKNRQTTETLQSMIARAYGAAQVPVGENWVGELGHGWFNVAYRLRLRDGAEVVVKIAPPPGVEVMTYELGAMRTEVAALELIGRETTVPVPKVDFADTATISWTPPTSSCRTSLPTTWASSPTRCRRRNARRTKHRSARRLAS
jgi:hypothetical protein